MSKKKKKVSSPAAENGNTSAAGENTDSSLQDETDSTVTETASETNDKADNEAPAEKLLKEAEEGKNKKKISPEKSAEKTENKKYLMRKLRYGSAATAITVIVVALVVLVNVIMSMLSDRINMTIDATPDGTFEITQESIDYLETVNEPVDIVCMTSEAEFSTSPYIYFKQAYEVLKKYTIYSQNIKLTFVDMTKDPTYANRYKELYNGDIDQYSIVVSSDKRIKVIAVQDLFNVERNYYNYSQQITSSNAEQELTSAIMYVTDPDPMNAVVFNSETGGASYDNVITMLRSNGYNVSEINPLIDAIPEETDIICVNAPLNDYDEDTVQKIYDFLDNGGKLGRTMIYIADTSQNPANNMNALLAEWGVQIEEGVVGDSNSSNTSSSSNYIIGSFIDTNENEYAANVADTSLPVLSYYSRPITLLFDENSNRLTKSLVQTDDTGFILTEEMQTALENGENYEPEFGSYTTMAAARKYIFDEDNNIVYSNILIVGSSVMLSETLTSATYYNNGDYFISALNTLTGKTNGINIVAKDLTSDTFDMDQKTYSTCYGVFIFAIPAAVIVVGIGVYLKRRHK